MATDRVAAAIAALSPRNPWTWNVQDAAAYAFAVANGHDMPTATTFGANRRNAWAFLNGTHDWTSSALKVRSFVSNIMGDLNAVTVDVWAIRVATGGLLDAVPNDATYIMVANAYREAARIVGETPRDLQAITWLIAQTADNRAVKRPKRGTFDVVLDALGLPVQQSFAL
jgi:hypothetical protein